MDCVLCRSARVCARTSAGAAVCRACFVRGVEEAVLRCVREFGLVRREDHVAVGVSGGKDSAALAWVLARLQAQHRICARLSLVAVDEGIVGYRDRALECVAWLRDTLGLPLEVVAYRDVYGLTLDDVVRQGGKNACSYCGVLRRQCLETAAARLGATVLATGHNADDVAETVLMNVLRGDVGRLGRSRALLRADEDGAVTRVKPFALVTQKEVVLYAHFCALRYFSVECSYAGTAFRGNARAFLQDVQRRFPRVVLDAVASNEQVAVAGKPTEKKMGRCRTCGMHASGGECQACVLLRGLKVARLTVN